MPSIVWIIWACIIIGPVLLWLIFRGQGYKRHILDQPPTIGIWTRTGERFIDTASNTVTEVWTEQQSGERAYVRASNEGDR